jgi:glycine/D-amino acid oxidase-like deaminating enzyme
MGRAAIVPGGRYLQWPLMVEHDILVRGSGAVGLVAALALSRQGLRVLLQGSAPGAAPDSGAVNPQADVRAFALNPASVKLLLELKVWDALPAHTRSPVYEMHIQGDEHGVGGGGVNAGALEFSAWSQGVAELAWIVDAAALENALQSAAAFAPHITRLAPEQAPPAVALQVLAEGKASASRAALGVQWTQHVYGQHAVAARLLGTDHTSA